MRKKTWNQLFLLSLPIVILLACTDDHFFDGERSGRRETTSRFCPTEARQLFERELRFTNPYRVGTRSADGGQLLAPNLDWNLAKTGSDSRWDVVEVPWAYENGEKPIFAFGEVWRYHQENNLPLESIVRLVMMRERRTGLSYMVKVKIAPTLEYILNNRENLHAINPLELSSNFSGFVMYYAIDGQFINGWQLKNGVLLGRVLHRRVSDAGVGQTTPLKTRGWWDDDPNHCPTYLDEVIVTAPGSRWRPRPDFVEVFPPSSGSGSGSGGSNNSGGGGGSNSGSQNIPRPPASHQSLQPLEVRIWAPNASQIFRNNSLSEAEWRRLENLLEQMMNSCLGEALFTELANELLRHGSLLFVTFANQDASTFNFRNGLVTLGLGGLDYSILFHEMFHGLQAYRETQASISENRNIMNIEVEAQFAQYLKTRYSPDSPTRERWLHHFRNNPTGATIANIGRVIDERGNIRPGFTPECVNHWLTWEGQMYKHDTIYSPGGVVWMLQHDPWYAPYHGRRNSQGDFVFQFDHQRVGADNFRSLHRIATHCF